MKKLPTTKLHNFSRFKTFVLVASPSKILNYHYTLTCDYRTYRIIDSFGINFMKSYKSNREHNGIK